MSSQASCSQSPASTAPEYPQYPPSLASSSGSGGSTLSSLSSEQFQDFVNGIHPSALAFAPTDFPTWTTSISGSQSISDPTTGKLLERYQETPKTINRPRTCFIYKHMPDSDPETKYYSSRNRNQLEWRCRYCSKRYALNGGTRLIRAHLRHSHEITQDSPRADKFKKRQQTIQEAMETGETQNHKRRRFEGLSDNNTLNADTLEVLWINMIVSCNLPLRLIECDTFRALLQFISPDGAEILPESPTIIQGWLKRQFNTGKQQVKHLLQSALTVIHLTVDVWTSCNGLGLFGVIAHFIDEDGNLQELALGIKELEGSHTGSNIAHVLLAILDDYGITSKLGYLQMDNATNNDTLIRELAELLPQEYDPDHYRIRCYGHISNLTLQALLNVDDDGALEGLSSTEELNEWLRRGPLGKLHIVAVKLHRTTVLNQKLKRLTGGLTLPRDNTTRWSSWYRLITASLRLKDHIMRLMRTLPAESTVTITDEDWEVIQVVSQTIKLN